MDKAGDEDARTGSPRAGEVEEDAPEAGSGEPGPGAGEEGGDGTSGGDSGQEPDGEDRLTEEIRQELKELEELRDRHLRLAAEFDNFRKRTRREMVDARERAQADLAREIVEVLDDLDRVAASNLETTSLEVLHEGVELVERKLRKKLEDAGVTRIEAAGEPFDPEVHEALTSIPTDDPEEDGTVGEVITPGYRIGDRLLRAAQVAVKQLED